MTTHIREVIDIGIIEKGKWVMFDLIRTPRDKNWKLDSGLQTLQSFRGDLNDLEKQIYDLAKGFGYCTDDDCWAYRNIKDQHRTKPFQCDDCGLMSSDWGL